GREVATGQTFDRKAERGQDRHTLLGWHADPAKGRRALGSQHITAAPIRDRTGCHDLGSLAAAEIEHQPGRDLEPGADEAGIKPALEAIAGVARYIELAAGRRGAHGVE